MTVFLKDNNFDGVWSTNRSDLTADQETSPFGDSVEEMKTDNANSENAPVVIDFTIDVGTENQNKDYLFSAFIKDFDLGWAQLRILSVTSQTIIQYYNTTTGATGTPTGDVLDSGAVQFNDNWWRLWLGFNPGGDNLFSLRIAMAEADGDADVVRNSGKIMYPFGAKLELGTLLGPYSPTSGHDAQHIQGKVFGHIS